MRKVKLTKAEVEKIASLANLPLSKKEKKASSEQLSSILAYFEKIASVQTKGVEPTFNTTGLVDVTRPDKAEGQLGQKEALSNAPRKFKGHFVYKGSLIDE